VAQAVRGSPGAPSAGREQTAKCAKCGHENRPGARFCAECGHTLRVGGCPRCAADIRSTDKFCSQCGLNLKQGGQTPPVEPDPPVKEPAPPAEPEISYPTFKIGGFHDVGFNGGSSNNPKGFTLGQFVLHTNSALARNVQFFSELSFTPRADAGTGSPAAPGYNPEIERAIIRFDYSDLLRLSAGRYHTPINWWNTAYHHGLWLQTSISRPEMVRFGSQFIPVHFVGALVEGNTPRYGVDWNYKLGLGNGRSSVVSRANDFGDNNAALAWLANIYGRPDFMQGLQIGGSVYRDKITLTSGRRFHEWITSLHAVLETETPEVIAEYSRINHREVGGPSSNKEGYYVQVAYRLPGEARRWKPYARYEKLSVPAGDPVLTATPSVQGGLFGIRYEVSDLAALKLEYRDLRRSILPHLNGFFGQLSYVF
jgi:hypothetical protein